MMPGIMEDHFVPLGIRQVWGGEEPFGLSRADRRHHVVVVGQTGSGKTTLLKQMIVADLLAGEGLVLIDPHGDLAEELLDLFPPWRTQDLLYFDPGTLDHPIGFNMLAAVPVEQRHLVVDGIVSALKSIWGESWGPRMQHVLANALAALTECQNVSLLSVSRMLVDDRYRHWAIKQVRDPAVLQFWTQEFSLWDQRFRAEATAPILNKIGALLLSPPMRNVLGQVRSAFDPHWLMNNRKVFIANLSRGRLGQENSSLMGSLLVATFGLAALSRAEMPPRERRDVTIYVDEFSTLAGEAFGSMLAENRKYRVATVLACQQFCAVRPQVLDAILGNVGTTVAFRVGEKDAQVLARQFGGSHNADAFAVLGNHKVLVKKLEDGDQHEPFSGHTLPDDHTVFGRRESLLRHCRQRYATPRHIVENKINRWLQGKAITSDRSPQPHRRRDNRVNAG
jgi:uncharacterized protein DUF87